jgi:hypothetical protein
MRFALVDERGATARMRACVSVTPPRMRAQRVLSEMTIQMTARVFLRKSSAVEINSNEFSDGFRALLTAIRKRLLRSPYSRDRLQRKHATFRRT